MRLVSRKMMSDDTIRTRCEVRTSMTRGHVVDPLPGVFPRSIETADTSDVPSCGVASLSHGYQGLRPLTVAFPSSVRSLVGSSVAASKSSEAVKGVVVPLSLVYACPFGIESKRFIGNHLIHFGALYIAFAATVSKDLNPVTMRRRCKLRMNPATRTDRRFSVKIGREKVARPLSTTRSPNELTFVPHAFRFENPFSMR